MQNNKALDSLSLQAKTRRKLNTQILITGHCALYITHVMACVLRFMDSRYTVVTRLNAPAFILNLESLNRCLFEIRSLLELFIHEAMDFLH